MTQLVNRIFFIFILCSSTLAALSNAQAEDPQQVVQHTTEQVLAIVKDAKGNSTADPQRFNTEVIAVMDKVIDFDDFARSVMGTYASGQRYKSLTTDAEKAVFRERIQKFSSTFKQGLIETYVTSLLKFNGEKIETLPLQKGTDLASGSASVMQHISNETGKPYVVQYTMHRNEKGEWKLKNLIIEGINLGLTYRSQFAAAAEKYQGDLDKVIANWRVEPKIPDTVQAGTLKKETNK